MYPKTALGVSIFSTLGACALVLAGCARKAAEAPPPADVQVVAVARKDVPVTREWVGSLDGFVNAQVRAQVQGILVAQPYKEGAFVHRGDVLFQIDPRPFAAALDAARGALSQAEAELAKAEEDVARYQPLARDKAVSQEELDDAIHARMAARAKVESMKAAAESARLSEEFSRVTSPIDGIAGLARGQIGDLVGPSTGTLTTVSQVDPIKAYFPVSEQSYLEFRRHPSGAEGLPPGIEFELILSDGSVYPRKGTFYAIDNQVDANTGTLRAAATFPNPDGLLRPGQFARVRAVIEVEKGALVVPSRALAELQGSYQVALVDATNHAHILSVKTGPQVGNEVVILSGLRPGDTVVADGSQKIREGAAVNPLPAPEPAR